MCGLLPAVALASPAALALGCLEEPPTGRQPEAVGEHVAAADEGGMGILRGPGGGGGSSESLSVEVWRCGPCRSLFSARGDAVRGQ